MKKTCNVCKTNFYTDKSLSGAVRCPMCGMMIHNKKPANKKSLLTLFASICALLAVSVFSYYSIKTHRIDNMTKNPLIAEVLKTNVITVEGEKQIEVYGRIKNISEYVYGVPNVFVISKDKDDNILSIQKFMPPATLLGSDEYVDFKYLLSGSIYDTAKITVQLKDVK